MIYVILPSFFFVELKYMQFYGASLTAKHIFLLCYITNICDENLKSGLALHYKKNYRLENKIIWSFEQYVAIIWVSVRYFRLIPRNILYEKSHVNGSIIVATPELYKLWIVEYCRGLTVSPFFNI